MIVWFLILENYESVGEICDHKASVSHLNGYLLQILQTIQEYLKENLAGKSGNSVSDVLYLHDNGYK